MRETTENKNFGSFLLLNLRLKLEKLIFINVGKFISKDIETVIEQYAPQEYYRNQF